MDNSYQIDMALIMPEYPIPKYKDGGIHIKKENRGKFNALKKRTGKSTEERRQACRTDIGDRASVGIEPSGTGF